MLPRHVVPAAFLAASLLSLPSFAAAQAAPSGTPAKTTAPKAAPAAVKPRAQEAAPKPAAVVPVKARSMGGPQPLQLAVSGLTKEKSAQVTTALAGLSQTFYQCPGCKHEQAEAGHCASCNKDLVAEHAPILHEVAVDAAKGTVGFALQPHRSLHLRELTKALGDQGVTLVRDKLSAGDASSLVVTGVTAENATKVETALRDAKLFESVSGRFDTTAKELLLSVHSGPASLPLGHVDEALAKADPAAKLVDVIWNGPTAMG